MLAIALLALVYDSKLIHAQGTTYFNNNNLFGEDNSVYVVDNVNERDNVTVLKERKAAIGDENRVETQPVRLVRMTQINQGIIISLFTCPLL